MERVVRLIDCTQDWELLISVIEMLLLEFRYHVSQFKFFCLRIPGLSNE